MFKITEQELKEKAILFAENKIRIALKNKTEKEKELYRNIFINDFIENHKRSMFFVEGSLLLEELEKEC